MSMTDAWPRWQKAVLTPPIILMALSWLVLAYIFAFKMVDWRVALVFAVGFGVYSALTYPTADRRARWARGDTRPWWQHLVISVMAYAAGWLVYRLLIGPSAFPHGAGFLREGNVTAPFWFALQSWWMQTAGAAAERERAFAARRAAAHANSAIAR
jgi:hypothetical protein